MGFKVDEVFVDFVIDFSRGEQAAVRINAQMAKLGKVSGAAADAQDRVERSTRRAGAATRATAKDTKKLGKESKDATTQIKGMLKTLLGLELARRVVRALLTTFVSFRTEMNNVRAITDATDEEFKRLNATAMELGRTTQFTATDAASAMAFLARTGLDVNQTIAVLPGTLNLAAATAVDLATAADLSTNILKGMGMEISELDGLVDVLAKTTNSANVNIFELGEAMKAVAPLAADVGMSVQETAALIGKLGDAGIKGSLAGTSLRRMLINLTTGAEGAQAVIDRLGITIFDAEGDFVGLTNVIGQLERAQLQAGDEFKLFGARGLAAGKVLRRTGEVELQAFTDGLLDAEGTAKRMAEQQMAGLPGALKILQAQTEATSISWGGSLEPALTLSAKALGLVLNVINGVLAAFKLVGPAAFVMASAVGLAFETVQNVVGIAVGGLLNALGSLLRMIGEAGERFGILDGVSEKLANVGAAMQRTGARIVRDDIADQAAAWREMGFAVEGAKAELVETANVMTGTSAAAAKAAANLEALKDATDRVKASMQQARTELNIDVFQEQLDALRGVLRFGLGLGGAGALDLEERLEVQRRLVAMTDDNADAVMDLVDAERTLATAVGNVLGIQEALNEAGQDQEKIAELTAQLEEAISALAAATIDAQDAMEGLGATGEDAGRQTLRGVSTSLRAINRLGDAFGLVDDNVRQIIDSVLDMVKVLDQAPAASAPWARSAGSSAAYSAAARIRRRCAGSRSARSCSRRTTCSSRAWPTTSGSRCRPWRRSPARSSAARWI
ncbi:MAG: phage tail tape measure protein [Planctomycetota bacterium]|jgi:TP901 family phage tail tape measure protein